MTVIKDNGIIQKLLNEQQDHVIILGSNADFCFN